MSQFRSVLSSDSRVMLRGCVIIVWVERSLVNQSQASMTHFVQSDARRRATLDYWFSTRHCSVEFWLWQSSHDQREHSRFQSRCSPQPQQATAWPPPDNPSLVYPPEPAASSEMWRGSHWDWREAPASDWTLLQEHLWGCVRTRWERNMLRRLWGTRRSWVGTRMIIQRRDRD